MAHGLFQAPGEAICWVCSPMDQDAA